MTTPPPILEELPEKAVIYEENFGDKGTWMSRVTSFTRLLVISACYGLSFVTMVHFGMWLANLSTVGQLHFQERYTKTEFFDWLYDVILRSDYKNPHIMQLLINFGLLLTFSSTHSLLSSRILKETFIWYYIRHQYKLDKMLYMFMTATTLWLLMQYWEYIPVKIWTAEFLLNYYWGIHCFAWACLYGTSLMLDLPEMIGLNQVIIESPTLTVKSPEFQGMCQKQRHMGLVPFLFIFIVFPYMSLDRLFLMLFLGYYTCRQWTSDSCYQYARNMKQVKKLRLSGGGH